MTEADEENLVQKTMTRKQFFSLFPWKSTVKFYFLFILYTCVCSIIIFSTEQCLKKQDDSEQHNIDQNKVQKNCSTIEVHVDDGIQEHDQGPGNTSKKKPIDAVINVEKYEKPADVDINKKCRLSASNIIRWIYFTVVHFHCSDTSYFHIETAWGKTLAAPIMILGIALATRLYTMIGFIGVNLINFSLRKLRARLRLHRKASLKYEIMAVAAGLKGCFILISALISTPYARAGIGYRDLAFKWMMLLVTISDEKLVPDAFTEEAVHLITPIVLIFIGFLFTSTFIGSAVNFKYRLTYKVYAKVLPKKTGLQGWWV